MTMPVHVGRLFLDYEYNLSLRLYYWPLQVKHLQHMSLNRPSLVAQRRGGSTTAGNVYSPEGSGEESRPVLSLSVVLFNWLVWGQRHVKKGLRGGDLQTDPLHLSTRSVRAGSMRAPFFQLECVYIARSLEFSIR